MLKTKIIIVSLFIISILILSGHKTSRCEIRYKISLQSPTQIIDTQGVTRLQYKIIVNYDKSIRQAIREGNYDFAIVDIASPDKFPAKSNFKGYDIVVFELLCFNKSITRSKIFREFDKRGLRPATLCELLAFGAQCQGNELNKSYIIALSAIYIKWTPGCGNLMTISIRQIENYRYLDVDSGLNSFILESKFLAVKIN